MGVFDELESVGAHRIVGGNGGGRSIVGEWTHFPDFRDEFV
jgi:hypothetical protein